MRMDGNDCEAGLGLKEKVKEKTCETETPLTSRNKQLQQLGIKTKAKCKSGVNSQ
jgi:hypothetical protein